MCRRGCPTLSVHVFVVDSVIVVVNPQSFNSACDYDTNIHYISDFDVVFFCFFFLLNGIFDFNSTWTCKCVASPTILARDVDVRSLHLRSASLIMSVNCAAH